MTAGMLRDIFGWWLRQMRAFLPHRLLPGDARADALLAIVDGPRGAPSIRFELRRRRRTTPLGRLAVNDTSQRAPTAVARWRTKRVVLQPDPTSVLERRVVLPLAAERDVASVLGYEMDRLTPFTAEQVFWSATVERRNRTAGRLELSLSLVPKAALLPVIAVLSRIGLTVSAIEATNRVGVARRIDTLAAASTRRPWQVIVAAAVGVLAIVAVVTPFVTQSLARTRVEARIAALQPRLAEVEALRRRIAAGTAGSDVIAAEQARLGDALQVLATITDLLPDDTVLADLTLRQGKLDISGRSLVAPRLIPAMAADPIVHNPAFVAPVTRTSDGKADTFVIHAELGP
jgi:general secretion pathway protein L